MIKWIINKLNIYKQNDFKYKGFIEFKVWNEKYYCDEINSIINNDTLNNKIKYESFINNLRWIDFWIHSRYKVSDYDYIFEIEILNSFLNPNKSMTYIEGKILN